MEKYNKIYIQDGPKWAWSACVTKFVISHSLNFFATFNDRPFKFYTELTREKYNNIYTQESGNRRVVECCVMLTSVAKSHDMGSIWPVLAYWLCVYIYEHVYFNCSMGHWTDRLRVRSNTILFILFRLYSKNIIT